MCRSLWAKDIAIKVFQPSVKSRFLSVACKDAFSDIYYSQKHR